MKLAITQILKQRLADRQAQNPSYSLRALARDLNINPASLSQTISGKRGLSRRNLERVAQQLGLSPLEVEKLRWDAPRASRDHGARILGDDEFRLVADWYYYAILNLAKIPGAKADPGWIAERLGIPKLAAGAAVERLERLGLVKARGSRLVRISGALNTANDVPSAALRSHHRQNIERAMTALDQVPVELREFASQTAAVSTRNLPKAKAAIRRFREELIDLLETGGADEVYTLCIQLFPVISRKGKDV